MYAQYVNVFVCIICTYDLMGIKGICGLCRAVITCAYALTGSFTEPTLFNKCRQISRFAAM